MFFELLTWMLGLKFFIAVLFVVGMSLLAEYVSPRVAGIISGYPTGSAITLFFFGLEQGAGFASESALFNMAGLSAMCVFILLYWWVSRLDMRYVFVPASLVAMVGYLLMVLCLAKLTWGRVGAVMIPMLAALTLIFLFRKVNDVKIRNKRPLSLTVLLWRAVFAAFIIVTITIAPFFLGTTWSGLFSAFPSTLFPLILIIHVTYGKQSAHTIIKNVPLGLFSLICYSLTVHVSYPVMGIYAGTLMAYLVATGVLLLSLRVKSGLLILNTVK